MKNLLLSISIITAISIFWFNCSSGPGDIASHKGGTSEHGNALTGAIGRAVYKDGTPAINAHVIIHNEFDPLFLGKRNTFLDTIMTDSMGNYWLPKLVPGSYYLEISGLKNINDDFLKYALRTLTHPAAETLITIPTDTLLPSGKIRGRFNTGTNDPVRINIIICELGRYISINKTSDTSEFIIQGLPQAVYSLRFQEQLNYSIVDTSGINVSSGSIADIGRISIPGQTNISPDSAYIRDTIAVRAILDSNNINLSVKEVTWARNGRIVCFQCAGNFTLIPDEIANLDQLTYFGICGDMGASQPQLGISDKISSLPLLSTVDIRYQNLKKIPGSFSMLISLSSLVLINDQLDSIPEFSGSLLNLLYLDLSQNKITRIPKQAAFLEKLAYLNIGNNRLADLPVEITALDCKINIEYNRLCTVPENVAIWLDNHFCFNIYSKAWKTTQLCK